jgi:hypothetical protein
VSTSIATLLPFAAEFPTSNFPQLSVINTRPVLWFDASAQETASWTVVAPKGFTGTLSLTLSYIMASATSGKVDWEVLVEAITSGDGAPDLDSATSVDTANGITALTVPATAGLLQQVVCTLTNGDSVADADYLRISVRRDAADATNDTATGDAGIVACHLWY